MIQQYLQCEILLNNPQFYDIFKNIHTLPDLTSEYI